MESWKIEAARLETDRGFTFFDALIELDEEVRESFASDISKERSNLNIAASFLVSYGVEWAGSITAMQKAGHFYPAYANLRIAFENTVNLYYIVFAGPTVESVAAESLARQFLHYGDVVHSKLFNKLGDESRERIRLLGYFGGKPYTTAQFDSLQSSVKDKADDFRAKYDPTKRWMKTRWHREDFESRIKIVLENMPPWFKDKQLLDVIKSGTTSWNSAIHASAFNFIRDYSQVDQGDILKFRSSKNVNASHIASRLALANWILLADLFGRRDEVEAAYERIWHEKLNAILETKRPPKMWRVSNDTV